MRLRNVENSWKKMLESKYIVENPIENKGKWANVFKNDHPIHIEIGMGKGQFLLTMAEKYPDINFIGIEKYSSVLLRATEKASEKNLNNLLFICMDAKEIREVFAHEISVIYLNFSDPWPKSRHAKRRLTSPLFLSLYDDIFKDEKHIIQKTDNIALFAYSLEELSKHGYVLERVSLDLANDHIINVLTEYEEKFHSLGYKICYVEAIKKE